MAITVHATTTTTVLVGTGNTSINLPGTPAQNDIVVVFVGCDIEVGDGTDGAGGIQTAGYSDIDHPATTAPGLQLAWKRMGATPDSAVVVAQKDHTDNAGDQAVIVEILRGVDPTTALDVTPPAAATGGSLDPDPPSITPVTDGCRISIYGALDDDHVASSVVAPTNYSDTVAHEANEENQRTCTIMIAGRTLATAAAEDPGTFDTAGSDDWRALTVAWRPAAAVAGKIPSSLLLLGVGR